MRFNRIFADEQRTSDLVIRRADTQLIQDLFFPMSKEGWFRAVITIVTRMCNQVTGKLLRKVAFAAQDALQPIDNTFLILHGIKNAVDMRPVFNVAVRVIFRRI